jgi:hypothetical protein
MFSLPGSGRLVVLYGGVTFILFFLIISTTNWRPSVSWTRTEAVIETSTPRPIHAPTSPSNPKDVKWNFDPLRDERHFGLTEDQCNSAFPDLYREIDRAVAARSEHGLGTILPEDIDMSWQNGGGSMRILIHDRQVSESCDPVPLHTL